MEMNQYDSFDGQLYKDLEIIQRDKRYVFVPMAVSPIFK
jgi:hypothetical protein